ncbi:protein phosphatase CheZ [Acidisphaera sp. S103]|uniref:protein phosphatase CheZ n=1 Tax=Acidisphaera sp. S103 TaxID=1747223 RepID=UPI00131A66EF|nr:protein phosphatase CheZ [Acidisphaera sp. S103]
MLDSPNDPHPIGIDALKQKLAAIRNQQPQIEPGMITEVVRAVLTTISDDLTAKESSLLREVEELGQMIANTKSEIAALRVDDITDHDIPFATDELDAIVEHTAHATDAILESCEMLDEVSATVSGDAAAKLQAATTKIYEACSFQDITGQRITKVVNTLKTIEGKVAHIVSTFGATAAGARDAADHVATDADLLNGPQLPAHAMDQSDIDKLLADF